MVNDLKAFNSLSKEEIMQMTGQDDGSIISSGTLARLIINRAAEDDDGNQDDGKTIDELRKQMLTAAENLEFEEATRLRDKIIRLEKNAVGVNQA